MRKYVFVTAGLLLSVVLGATVFSTPLAWAAQAVNATIVGPLDANGNVKVHEQGTAAVRAANEEVSFSTNVLDDGQGLCAKSLYTVPAGKQLVVEWIGAIEQSQIPGATGAHANIVGALHVLPFVFQEQHFNSGLGVKTDFVASQAVHFVFPAGASLDFQGLTAATPPGCNFYVSVGGYLQPSS